MSTAAAKAKQADDVATAVMPEELKAKGWKLEQRTINDDQTVYIAGNEDLALSTRKDTAEEAILEAIILQAREDSETLNLEDARARLEEMREREAAPTAQATSVKDIGGFRPSVDASPLHQAQIRLDGGTQPREELDTRIVDRYAEDMAAGALFPPVTVFLDGKAHWLADGFHRFFAYKQFLDVHHPHRERIVQAEIHSGTKRDAILFSLGANATHGLPRSAEDKYRAVMRLLEDPEWRKWSDSAIAGAAYVSQPFVSAIRREIDKPATEAGASPLRKKIEKAAGTSDLKRFESPGTKKIGKDKVARDTKAIGRQAAAETIKVTDKRRFTETGVARSSVSTETKNKATDIQKLLKGRPLHVSFTWLPGVPGVSVSVRREKPELAVRKMIAADLMPPMPEAVRGMITEQLAAKAGKATPKKKAATSRAPKRAKVVMKKKPPKARKK